MGTPMAGFQGVLPYGAAGGPQRKAPMQYAPGAGGSGRQGGGRTNRYAVEGAKAFKDALGLPSYEDILSKVGGSTREFGNADRASAGAGYLRGELDAGKEGLSRQQRNIAMARSGIRNPTKQAGFKSVMRLTNERLGHAQEQDRQAAAEAASRRGFVGGYSGERGEQERREAIATAGYEAAAAEREAQQALFGGEADLYGSLLGARGQQLGAYTDLTKTAAELPTKWLDAYSGLLSGIGGYGDIFGTAMKGAMFDEGNRREDSAFNRRKITAERDRIRSGQSSGFA